MVNARRPPRREEGKEGEGEISEEDEPPVLNSFLVDFTHCCVLFSSGLLLIFRCSLVFWLVVLFCAFFYFLMFGGGILGAISTGFMCPFVYLERIKMRLQATDQHSRPKTPTTRSIADSNNGSC